jgi:mono/diheme cytochrome c family protein
MSELQLGNPFFNAHRSILKFGLVGGMALFTLAGPSHAAEVYIDAEDVVPSKTRAFVSEFCVGCHNPEKLKGDLDLESLLDQSGLDSYEIWEDVEWMLSEREMPPADEPDVPRPTEAVYVAAVDQLDGYLKALWKELPANHAPLLVDTPAALVKEYCVKCHGGDEPKAGLSLVEFGSQDVDAHAEEWELVVRRMRAREMPPVSRKRPSEESYEKVLNQLIGELDHHAVTTPNPGRTSTFRRLTRHEYQNAVRDLLGFNIDTKEMLPKDESSHGFDNITVSDLTPSLLDRYITAAQRISRLAMGTPGKSPQGTTIRVAPDITQEGHMPGLPIGTRGGVVVDQIFSADGDYEIEVILSRDRDERVEGLTTVHVMEFLLDRERVAEFTLLPPETAGDHAIADADLRARVHVAAGQHQLGITFWKSALEIIETERKPFDARYNRHRHPRQTPAVYQVLVTGPFNSEGTPDTPTRKKIFVTTPAAAGGDAEAAEEILANLMRRAYRRPILAQDLVRPMELYRDTAAEEGFEAGIEMALSAVLVSSEFLIRIERDPAAAQPGQVYAVTDIELASRLSFFLWSSIPDEELLALAERGELSNPGVLEQQVSRMLADERADSLVKLFAGQWLYLRNVDALAPDLRLFPDFDANLQMAMRQETELFFESILKADRSVLDLIKADYTFLNERLAKHYDIPHIYGSRFRRVELNENSERGGLLRHGSILSLTSYANRTSPVIRGHWVLENILGTPPPPPPPNIPALEDAKIDASLPIRDRLAVHRKNPVCASCHDIMDPVGFALENYDALGRVRYFENGREVDASGSLANGTKFVGVAGLEDAILDHPEMFVSTLTEKLLTFALGRGVEHFDAPAIREIVRKSAADDYRFSSLVLGIVESPPFTLRKAP